MAKSVLTLIVEVDHPDDYDVADAFVYYFSRNDSDLDEQVTMNAKEIRLEIESV